MYVACEEKCYMLTEIEWVEVPELSSTHEEADTRLLLHAFYAAESYTEAIIVTSEDTDAMVLCLAFQKDIPCTIYQKRGTKPHTICGHMQTRKCIGRRTL